MNRKYFDEYAKEGSDDDDEEDPSSYIENCLENEDENNDEDEQQLFNVEDNISNLIDEDFDSLDDNNENYSDYLQFESTFRESSTPPTKSIKTTKNVGSITTSNSFASAMKTAKRLRQNQQRQAKRAEQAPTKIVKQPAPKRKDKTTTAQKKAQRQDNRDEQARRGTLPAIMQHENQVRATARSQFSEARREEIRQARANKYDLMSIEERNRAANNLRTWRQNRTNAQALHEIVLAEERQQVFRRMRIIPPVQIAQEWDYEFPCMYCGCLWLKSITVQGRKKCCMAGAASYCDANNNFPKLHPLPEVIKCLMLQRTRHISPNSAMYNNIFSIASVGVENGRGNRYEAIMGDSCVTVNGRIYNYLHTANNSNSMSGGLSYFTFDSAAAVHNHANHLNSMPGANPDYQRIIPVFLNMIYQELKQINEFAMQLRNFGDRFIGLLDSTRNGNNNIRYDSVCHSHITQSMNVPNSAFQVGGIINDNNTGNIAIKYKLDNGASHLDGTSALVEPLCYPLFFPFGERGWCKELRKEFSFIDYLACRILQPEYMYDSNCTIEALLTGVEQPYTDRTIRMSCLNALQTNILPTNRFQLCSRLSSYYIVEEMCRAIDFQLQWHKFKKNQQLIFGLEDNSLTHFEADEDTLNDITTIDLPPQDEERRDEGKVFLADSFFGGPRHLKKQAQNALAIVSEIGRQTLFITLTCNTSWTEIQERLFDGQNAFEREDIVCMVFHARLSAFIHNLKHGKYFNGGVVAFVIYVIEYQHRGLPHAHIACRLSNAPNHRAPNECVEWIDQHICAELPTCSELSSVEDIQYLKLVKDNMIHKCAPVHAINGCIHKELHICTRGYSNEFPIEYTSLNEKGYPIYRRRRLQDLKVVPHNKRVLLDWNGHANVEYAGSTYSVMYLFKYIHKGNAKVRVDLKNTEDVPQGDEISLYLRGRMLSSMEATWRVLGYQTYPSSYPSVRSIKCKLPSTVKVFTEAEKICDMGVYFCRPNCEEFRYLLFTDFFSKWDYSYKLPSRFKDIDKELAHPAEGLYNIRVPGAKKYVWLYKRLRPQDSIVRMTYNYITGGEIWYLRQILLHYPCMSFTDAKSYNDVEYSSFQLAAIARGLFSGQNEAEICFKESSRVCTARELRSLFVLLTLQGFTSLTILANPDLKLAMMNDFYANNHNSYDIAEVMLFNDLNERFLEEDKDPVLFGIPAPTDITTELSKEYLKYNPVQQGALLRQLLHDIPNTDEQELLFVEVCAHLDTLWADMNTRAPERLFEIESDNVGNYRQQYGIPDQPGQLYFIQGLGGSGKSTFAKKLLAYARSKKLIAKGCSSTGLSCQVYEDFMTAHSLFGIPVVEDENDKNHEAILISNIKPDRLELLNHTSLIIWDEFLSNHKQCLECAYEVTNHFKNMVLVCMGDYRQIAPVVIHGLVPDIVRASMVSSPLWSQFNVHYFTKNMRLLGLNEVVNNQTFDDANMNSFLQSQQEYAQMLLEVGDGQCSDERVQQLDENEDLCSQLIRLPLIEAITDIQEGIDFLYPNGFDPDTMSNSSILAVTNEDGDEWNSCIQDMNPGEERMYLSADIFDPVDDPNGFLEEMMTTEALNKFTKNGCPPHVLTLKVNDICILLRTLSKTEGLSNNTRVRITHLGQFHIKIVTLGAHPKEHVISRIRFNFAIPFGHSFTMTRTQFPLRLAYCMTYNKAQGQEWERVLVDIRKPAFTHGHLYVVLSRIRQSRNIRIFCNKENILQGSPITNNVFYSKLKIHSNN